LESWGGDVPLIKTSSKTGEGIDELLETILILGAVTIKASDKKKEKNFKGIIIETHLSSQSGIRATILVKQGMFSKGDLLVSQKQIFKVKKITDWRNKNIKTAHPSQPVNILGFNFSPELGEIFEKAKMGETNLIKKSHSQKRDNFNQKILINKSKSKKPRTINLILKTDVLGSQEAIIKIIENISQKNDVNFLLVYQGLGDISEYDLKFAESSKAIILGFKVRAQSAIQFAIERMNLNLILCEVIYDINDSLTDLIKMSVKKETKDIQAKLKILAVFGKRSTSNNKKQNIYKIIIGGKVTEGELKKNCSVEIHRSNKILGQGKILEIEKDRKPAKQISAGEQCGLLYEGNAEVKKGDILFIYEN
jgi:translation initiation factor IF-2